MLRQIRAATLLASIIISPAGAFALDIGVPAISPPLQYENFFDTSRLSVQTGDVFGHMRIKPQIGISHLARESDSGGGASQITHKIHGEAGGRLILMENLSLTAVARLPLYTYQLSSVQSVTSEGRGSTDMLRTPASSFSWRSELGLNLGKGIDLNLFYDKARFGRVDRPGVNDLDERFGTRFIFHFK